MAHDARRRGRKGGKGDSLAHTGNRRPIVKTAQHLPRAEATAHLFVCQSVVHFCKLLSTDIDQPTEPLDMAFCLPHQSE